MPLKRTTGAPMEDLNRVKFAMKDVGSGAPVSCTVSEDALRKLSGGGSSIASADAQAFNDKIKELEAARPDLEARLSRPADQPLLHPNLAKVYREKVERLTEAFQEPRHGREIFELIRSLIREVRLVPGDGGLTIELAGDLAGILALSKAGKETTASGPRALQIKMVAGTGFELMTFRFSATTP